uniref:Transcription-repair-coupling factor n=1 Tax=candidate division WOR-3 bacterium TaxID=2052148 RepID=A0A7C3UPP0_UNCW3
MKLLREVFAHSIEFNNFLKQFTTNRSLCFPTPTKTILSFLLSCLKKIFPNPFVLILKGDLTAIGEELKRIGEEEVIVFQGTPKVMEKILSPPKDFFLLLRDEDLNFSLPKKREEFLLKLKRGNFPYERLLDWLTESGFLLTDFVSEEGEFARRGSVIDFFPEDHESPIRVEFFGDEIISLRSFDPLTQRSIKELEEVELFLPRKGEGEKLSSLLPENSLFLIEEDGLSLLSTHFGQRVKEFPLYQLPFSPPKVYLSNFKLLKSEIESGNFQYYIVCPDYLNHRLERILGEKPTYLSGFLSGGFILPETGISVLTEKEIYGTPKLRPPKRKFKGLTSDELLALKKGDFVVHWEYGIGQFEGVKREAFDNIPKDYLVIRYAEGSKVYVPVENLGFVDKYRGLSSKPPKLDHIGKWGFKRAKSEAERDCSRFAEELLFLYAKRAISKKVPFSPDSEWQEELEADFPYEETEDQIRTLAEIKRDMESEKPMDRLVCGDPGYGKTELALRAALKAVNDFKQVALLAPTTILCLQHFNTFSERLKKFPIRVACLSRFLSKEERERILREIREGKIDIVIGTHLLLKDEVKFSNLGLLIIDEEQRFGVESKEKIKKIKEGIDVLTLTATPIPRTLYLALSGIKEISIINTPPLGRKGVITEVINWDEEKIRFAIMREVARGGQVFFIHNRIRTIHKKEAKLKEICPEVRIAVAHAKMREDKLVKVYTDFLCGRYDLLLTTSLIQSGIDIPNASTIIVDEAHNFGLADLHQLRGRVGRSEKEGYCFFIVPETRNLTAQAKERIEVITTYTQLGSGFKLALADMEIRGIGNILGKEQSGHISRVGFNLYCQLLKSAISKLRQERINPEPELSLDIPSYIPEEFIPSPNIRVAIYKRILQAEREEEIHLLKEEILDRFGKYPEVMENLFLIGLIRIRAKEKGIRKIVLKGEKIKIINECKEIETTGDINTLLSLLKFG